MLPLEQHAHAVETKQITPLDTTAWDIDATAISDDGQLFAYTFNREGFSELYVRALKPDGTLGPKPAPVNLPGKGIVGGLEFSHDAHKLALIFNGARYNSDVWLYDVKARTLTPTSSPKK